MWASAQYRHKNHRNASFSIRFLHCSLGPLETTSVPIFMYRVSIPWDFFLEGGSFLRISSWRAVFGIDFLRISSWRAVFGIFWDETGGLYPVGVYTPWENQKKMFLGDKSPKFISLGFLPGGRSIP